MKVLKYIFTAAAVFGMMASCTIVGEDTFSTDPTAPVMVAHEDILITQTDIAQREEVTFVWEEARYLDAEKHEYDLYVNYSGTDVLLAEDIEGLKYSLKEEAFRTFLMDNFTLEPKNYTHTITVFVTITDDKGIEYKAAPVAVKVFLYDEAVPAAVETEAEEIVLDIKKLTESVALLRWEPARLTFGEEPSYSVRIKVGNGEEVELEDEIYENRFSCVIDDLNEKISEAGGAENAANDVKFLVYAFSDTYTQGVPSEAVTINITTYSATFPETLSLTAGTGNVLGLSKKTKGFYRGFVDLGSASEVSFRFAYELDGQAGQASVAGLKVEGETVKTITASGAPETVADMTVPGGFYYIEYNMKFSTLKMIQVNSLQIVGDLNGWDGTDMTWNADKKTWTVPSDLEVEADKYQYKFRFNGTWDVGFIFKADGDLAFGGMDNMAFPAAGTFSVTIDASNADFGIAVVNMASDYYLVGALQGWNNSDKKCILYPLGGSKFSYTTSLAADKLGFKVWPAAEFGNWSAAYGAPGGDTNAAEGTIIKADGTGALKLPEAGKYYTTTFDFKAGTFKHELLADQNPKTYETIGIVGSFNGWTQNSDSYQMTQVADAPHNWYLMDFEIAGTGVVDIKFNANKDWADSWGGVGSIDDNRFGKMYGPTGAENCKITAGKYDIYFNDITAQYIFVKK